MEWDEWYETPEGISCQVYLAEILGSHPVYRFDRAFLRMKYSFKENGFRCRVTLDDNGVFEERARWFDKDGKLIKDSRCCFVLFERDYYEIDPEDVLHTLFNLRLQL